MVFGSVSRNKSTTNNFSMHLLIVNLAEAFCFPEKFLIRARIEYVKLHLGRLSVKDGGVDAEQGDGQPATPSPAALLTSVHSGAAALKVAIGSKRRDGKYSAAVVLDLPLISYCNNQLYMGRNCRKILCAF